VSAPGGEFDATQALSPGFGTEVYEPAMVTTDQSGCTKRFLEKLSDHQHVQQVYRSCHKYELQYTNTMNGTSSATPVTAGVRSR